MQSNGNTLRWASAALVLALLGGVTLTAQAEDYELRGRSRFSGSHGVANGNLVDVQVQVEGRTAPFYFRPGYWDRHYFQAFKGRNYSLVVRNNTGRRVGVLIAVDGINVVNGEKSRLARNESMYVLGPYERAVIRGWRTSLDDIRQFVFVDEERSYAERTGQANGDLGWIRVLSFNEDRPVVRYRPGDERDWLGRNGDLEDGPAAPRAQAEEKEGRLNEGRQDLRSKSESFHGEPDANPGTGWGSGRYDPVRETEFRAARHATDQVILRYEYASGLRAIGIIPGRNRLWDREQGTLGFAQPPRR
jgi:hypothetical protein